MKSNVFPRSFGLVVFLIFCTLLEPLPGRAQPESDVTEAYKAFGFDLLAQMRKSFPGSNIFISPVRGGSGFGNGENGAGGQTREEMRKVLHIGGPERAGGKCRQRRLASRSAAEKAIREEI